MLLYGLNLQVDDSVPIGLPLPAVERTTEPDVTLRRGAPASTQEKPGTEWRHFYNGTAHDDEGEPEFKAYRHALTHAIRMVYSCGFIFTFDRAGTSVELQWPEQQDPNKMVPALLGPVMGVLLRLRGHTCLHASAVAIDGVAVALVGESGAGKSTTAAAFARLGYPVVCDDVLCLHEVEGDVRAVPAYPRIRLWPESAAGLFGDAHQLPRMAPGWDKRVLDLQSPGFQFQQEPLALGAVVFLGPRGGDPATPQARPKRPAEALMQLVADSFATNFQDKADRAREFELLSRLVNTVPLRQISAPADLGQIDRFCNAIVRDVRHQRSPQPA